jgi:hypothetical protein
MGHYTWYLVTNNGTLKNICCALLFVALLWHDQALHVPANASMDGFMHTFKHCRPATVYQHGDCQHYHALVS